MSPALGVEMHKQIKTSQFPSLCLLSIYLISSPSHIQLPPPLRHLFPDPTPHSNLSDFPLHPTATLTFCSTNYHLLCDCTPISSASFLLQFLSTALSTDSLAFLVYSLAPFEWHLPEGRDFSLSCCTFGTFWYFPGGSDGKATACNAGDLGSIPGSERSPGEGNGNPLQNSCLENSMDGGA